MLKELLTSPVQHAEVDSKLRSLQPRVEAAQKKETAEMLDKLKGFGNSILGPLVRLLSSKLLIVLQGGSAFRLTTSSCSLTGKVVTL